MAFKSIAHMDQVFRTQEYRRMITEWVQNLSPVPKSVFDKAFGEAFFAGGGRRAGEGIQPNSTNTSRAAFVKLMKWTGRAPDYVEDWDDWLDFSENTP